MFSYLPEQQQGFKDVLSGHCEPSQMAKKSTRWDLGIASPSARNDRLNSDL